MPCDASLTVEGAAPSAPLHPDPALATHRHSLHSTHVPHPRPTQVGGPIALVKDGDDITIDAKTRVMDVHISDEEMAARRAAWKAPPLKATSGTLYKYIKVVGSASEGCVTDA